jgi:hypothetical protein
MQYKKSPSPPPFGSKRCIKGPSDVTKNGNASMMKASKLSRADSTVQQLHKHWTINFHEGRPWAMPCPSTVVLYYSLLFLLL